MTAHVYGCTGKIKYATRETAESFSLRRRRGAAKKVPPGSQEEPNAKGPDMNIPVVTDPAPRRAPTLGEVKARRRDLVDRFGVLPYQVRPVLKAIRESARDGTRESVRRVSVAISRSFPAIKRDTAELAAKASRATIDAAAAARKWWGRVVEGRDPEPTPSASHVTATRLGGLTIDERRLDGNGTPLDCLLVEAGAFPSVGDAHAAMMMGDVRVNGNRVGSANRVRRRHVVGDRVTVELPHGYYVIYARSASATGNVAS